MRKAVIVFAPLALLSVPAQAKLVDDAKTVREFVAACMKAQDACVAELFDQISQLAAEDDPLVCLSRDQQEEPIIVYRAMLRYLREKPDVAKLAPAEAIEHGADALYPCQGPF